MSDAPPVSPEALVDPETTNGPTFDTDIVALCEGIVKEYRRGEVHKAEAAGQLYKALWFHEVVEEEDLHEQERAYETYFDMLDSIDRERQAAGDIGDRTITSQTQSSDPNHRNTSPQVDDQPAPDDTALPNDVDETLRGRSKRSLLNRLSEPSPRKRQREIINDESDSESDRRGHTKRIVDESLFPFVTSIPEDVRQLSDILQRTLLLKENYTRDLTPAKQRVVCSPGCPPVPDSVWTDILANRYVDLDRVFSAIYTIDRDKKQSIKVGDLELSGLPTKPKKHVERHGHWTVAWALYQRAVLYTYPHREQELRTYYDQINGFFAAVSEHEAFRIINLDRAIRREVGHSNTLLLSDFSRFNHLYTMHVVGAGAAAQGPSQSSSTPRRNLARLLGSSSEACIRFNEGRCSSRTCRYRHVCSTCSGRDHVANACPQKASSGSNANHRK